MIFSNPFGPPTSPNISINVVTPEPLKLSSHSHQNFSPNQFPFIPPGPFGRNNDVQRPNITINYVTPQPLSTPDYASQHVIGLTKDFYSLHTGYRI